MRSGVILGKQRDMVRQIEVEEVKEGKEVSKLTCTLDRITW